MLRKLLKYDMKSLSRLLLPLSLVVILTSLAGAAAIRILSNLEPDGNAVVILQLFLGLVCISSIFILMAYIVFAQIFIFARYYTHLFTDEGYLTFTLPVKTTSILNAKVLAGFIWQFVSIIVMMLCVFIYVLVGSADSGLINTGILAEIGQTIRNVFESPYAGTIVRYFIELLFVGIISLIYSILSLYLALTIGSIIAKKHKILAGIGIYYAINTGIGIVSSIFSVIIGYSSFSYGTVTAFEANYHFVDFSILLYGAIFLLFAAGAYFLTKHLLTKKLNLS